MVCSSNQTLCIAVDVYPMRPGRHDHYTLAYIRFSKVDRLRLCVVEKLPAKLVARALSSGQSSDLGLEGTAGTALVVRPRIINK